MKALLVVYELNNKEKDYGGFYNTLKSASAWWHYLETCWLLQVSDYESADDWFKKLRPHIDEQKDYVLVIQVDPDYQGWLPKEAWDWVNKAFGR